MIPAACDGADLGQLGEDLGLLTHYAAVDSGMKTTASKLAGAGALRAVLGPQHGFWGETQDNMIEWEGYSDPALGVPVHSLYGASRKPTAEMLRGVRRMVVDLQDVGARYYTYIYTMALTMRACAEHGIPVTVLDRPNPLGIRRVEGRLLDTDYASFVGMYPIPVRHGLTIGELALLFAGMDGLPSPQVIPCSGPPLRPMDESLGWVMPSPNMPTPRTALVYPGMCLLEGTNLSEGRGTTRPFEIFGAPWLDDGELCSALSGSVFTRGAVLRRHRYIPTFGKHSGTLCRGAQIHVTDPEAFRPLRAALGILAFCFRSSQTEWRGPPYEYEREMLPIDILAGGAEIRTAVESGDTDSLLRLASPPLEEWRRIVEGKLIYQREMIE